MAVIEFSVGAGLVTVLLVYAVSVVEDDAVDPPSVVSKSLVFGSVGFAVIILGMCVSSDLAHYLLEESQP